MLNIHFANRFETLAGLFVQRLGEHARPVFAADEVIVPSAALQRSLTLALAQRHGICANVRFAYLARWLWQQIGRIVPGVHDESPFEAAVLAWRILAAFSDATWLGPHPRLAAYLERADPVMRFELAQRVAALVDQYITYRPDWLAAWSRGERADIGSGEAGTRADKAWQAALDDQAWQAALDDQAWQAALWRRLVAELGADDRHPVLAFKQALAAGPLAQAGDAGIMALPAAVHVFGLPALPPLHLDLLQALGRRIEVHVYALNPCREYWFEVADRRRLAYLAARGDLQHHEEGHRLLAGWGRQAQSSLGLLVDAGGETAVDDAHFSPHPGSHLLARLQNSLLELSELAPSSLRLDGADRSIEVHVCHSMTREIEVLQDRLLALIAAQGDLTPGEILVVTPDIDAAAPLIDAIFGTVPRERHIPYRITGRARSQANPVARALLDLLALSGSRLAASAAFGLLQQPLVARRFALDADALQRVHGWLQDAGVHWAQDAAHRASLGLPALQAHSFADGLDRLYLGYALPSQVAAPFDGRLPAGDAEGSGAAPLGALWRFVDALAALRQRLSVPQPATAWPDLLADALAGFVTALDDELDELGEVRAAIASLGEQWRRGAVSQALPLELVSAALAQALDDPARGGVPTGVLTFAAMSSLRSVPFKVICAIGLNDGAWPSGTRPAEFDLMALKARPGDRQRRVDERNVFLDLLLAAREALHLSYTGRSIRDNSALPPSVLVAELLDHLVPVIAAPTGDTDALARAHARLVVAHPLQPFAETAFQVDADPRLRSFNRGYAEALIGRLAAPPAAPVTPVTHDTINAPAAPAAASAHDEADDSDDDAIAEPATPFFGTPLPEPGDEWLALPIEQLVRFFGNPCRYLLEQRLGIALPRDEDELQDDEPFIPDVPRRTALARRLLPPLLHGLDAAGVRALALAGGEMPAGALGRHLLEAELAQLHGFAARVTEATRAPRLAPHQVSLALDIDGRRWCVHAGFADLRGDGLLRHRYDSLRAADYLAAWLQHLMLCAAPPAGVAPSTTHLGRDGRFAFKPCDDARAVLCSLLGLYRQGLREPLIFFPKSAWTYVDSGGSVSKARSAWQVSRHRPFAESADAGYRLALRGRPDPLEARVDEFEANALAVFGPLREHLA